MNWPKNSCSELKNWYKLFYDRVFRSGIYVLFLLGLFQSCSPLYIPNGVMLPMHNSAGEISASVYAGTAGIEGKGSYAFSSDLFAIASVSSLSYSSESNSQRLNFVETGIGSSLIKRELLHIDILGGFGLGSLSPDDPTEERNQILRLFIQPSIGWKGKIVSFGIVPRFAWVHSPSYTSNAYFIEPVMVTKIGYKNISIVNQLGLSIPLNEEQIDFTYQPFLFNFGLELQFPFK